MKHIALSNPLPRNDWAKYFVDERDYDVLYDEDVRLTDERGNPLLVLVKKAISTEAAAKAWGVLRNYHTNSDNRGVASGISPEPRKKMDGTYSATTRVPKGWGVESGIIGYFERTVRMPFCRSCQWNLDHPEKFAALFPMCQEATAKFEQLVPERFKVQKAIVDKTDPSYVIPNTLYTTLTINKNFRTACHLDAGDLEEGFSNMVVLKEGNILGGNLVLPRWRVAVKLDHGDLVMFNAHEWHGNTQIIRLDKKAQRCSIVMYYRTKMQHCLSPKEEAERAKNRKAGDSLYDHAVDNGGEPGPT